MWREALALPATWAFGRVPALCLSNILTGTEHGGTELTYGSSMWCLLDNLSPKTDNLTSCNVCAWIRLSVNIKINYSLAWRQLTWRQFIILWQAQCVQHFPFPFRNNKKLETECFGGGCKHEATFVHNPQKWRTDKENNVRLKDDRFLSSLTVILCL